MEIIFQSIQGAASLLVILQILIICGISLGLISILIKKTKLSFEAKTMPQAASVHDASVVQSIVQPADNKNEGNNKEIELLNIKIQELQIENEKIKTEKSEDKGLLEKVRYLETKLLEYEILQEEISTLSALKNENEQLKHKIQEFGGDQKSVEEQKDVLPKEVTEKDLELRKEPVALKDPTDGKQAA